MVPENEPHDGRRHRRRAERQWSDARDIGLARGDETPIGRVAAPVVLTFGLLTAGTGVYFMAFRPPLLPEDLRFTGLAPADVPSALLPWVSIVFRTWGGFIVGLGLCMLGHAAASITGRPEWSRMGGAAGVLFAFGGLLASNVQLHSDFLWFISLLFMGAVASAVVLARARVAGENG
jgi:hypothetical protein